MNLYAADVANGCGGCDETLPVNGRVDIQAVHKSIGR